MIRITPKLYLASMGEFGDVAALKAAGIELVISAIGSPAFPHSAMIGAIAVNIEVTGQHPDWMVRGIGKLISAVYGIKTLAICDEVGGLERASYILAAAYCDKFSTRFTAASLWLNTALAAAGPHRIPQALIAQGQALWP